MTPLDLASEALYFATTGASGLAALQSFRRLSNGKADQAVGCFFIVICFNSMLNGALIVIADRPLWLDVLPAVPLAAMAPLLWFYVDDLTADQAKVWTRSDAWSFGLTGFAILFTVAVAMFGSAAPAAGAVTPPAAPSQDDWALSLLSIALILAILVQSTLYVWRILDRLAQLPERLKRVFSDTSERNLSWLWAVMALLVVNWLITILSNLGVYDAPEIVFALLGLLFIMVLAVWATRQKPVFLGEGEKRIALVEDPPAAPAKYERSALPDDRLQRIAAKIDAAFDAHAMHLESDLSLRKLSERLSIPESQLSQTFTRQLTTTFYDYVNGRRIEAAKHRLSTTDETITDISYGVGFNSRSAFYNAFKAVTGQTPSDYRSDAKTK